MVGKRGSRKDCTFRTMSHARAQNIAWRHRGIAIETEIDREPVQVILNLLRRVEATEYPMLGGREQRTQPASVRGH